MTPQVSIVILIAFYIHFFYLNDVMKTLHIFIFLLFTGQAAIASTMEGWICNRQEKPLCLITHNGKEYDLTSKNYSLYQDLLKLEHGDYLVANVAYHGKDTLNVSHINYVGLRKILGSWKTAFGLVYNFDDFTTLNISNEKLGTTTYHYSITPQAGPDWSFFAIKDGITFARMELSKAFMRLHFYNTETGEVHSTVDLKQIYKK